MLGLIETTYCKQMLHFSRPSTVCSDSHFELSLYIPFRSEKECYMNYSTAMEKFLIIYMSNKKNYKYVLFQNFLNNDLSSRDNSGVKKRCLLKS